MVKAAKSISISSADIIIVIIIRIRGGHTTFLDRNLLGALAMSDGTTF
jgi:hypothetical protein